MYKLENRNYTGRSFAVFDIYNTETKKAIGWVTYTKEFTPHVFFMTASEQPSKREISDLIKTQFPETKGDFFLISELVFRDHLLKRDDNNNLACFRK